MADLRQPVSMRTWRWSAAGRTEASSETSPDTVLATARHPKPPAPVDGRLAGGAAVRGPHETGHPGTAAGSPDGVGSRGSPPDGRTPGELQVRGPWVAASYHRGETPDSWTPDGWFRTGDVAVVDSGGQIRILDRTKDLIKSGGEWISSWPWRTPPKSRRPRWWRFLTPSGWSGRSRWGSAARAGAYAGGVAGCSGPAVAQLVAARRLRVRRRDPQDQHGQAGQSGAPGAVPHLELELSRPDGRRPPRVRGWRGPAARGTIVVPCAACTWTTAPPAPPCRRWWRR